MLPWFVHTFGKSIKNMERHIIVDRSTGPMEIGTTITIRSGKCHLVTFDALCIDITPIWLRWCLKAL